MDKKRLDVELLFGSSKFLDPRSTDVEFDKYRISSVPTSKESLSDTHERILLKFYDFWKDDQKSSNPQKEADYILSFLLLMLQMKVEFDSVKINNVQGTLRKKRSAFLMGKMEFPTDFEDLFKKLHSLTWTC